MSNYKETIDKLDKDFGKTFCIKPFTEISTSSVGHMKLCCFSQSIGSNNMAYYQDKFENVFQNNNDLKSIRKAMLEGKAIKECRNCYVEEKNGKISQRQEENFILYNENKELFNNIVNKGTAIVKSIDLKFGNKCNYACIMCDTGSSSLHSKEIEANPHPDDVRKVINFEPYYFDFPDEKMDDLLSISSNLERVKSTGGEPFLLDGFKDYIKKLVDNGYAKNIHFTTVSNGTVDCTDLLPYMNQFKSFRLRWSIDGTDKVYNFIRYPGSFDRMSRVHKKISESIISNNYTNVEVQLDPTIQLFNVHNIVELLKYAESLKIISRVEMGYIYKEPRYLDTSLMPIDILRNIFDSADNEIKNINVVSNYNDIKELAFKKHNEYTESQKKDIFNLTKSMVAYWKRVRKLEAKEHISTYDKLIEHYSKM